MARGMGEDQGEEYSTLNVPIPQWVQSEAHAKGSESIIEPITPSPVPCTLLNQHTHLGRLT